MSSEDTPRYAAELAAVTQAVCDNHGAPWYVIAAAAIRTLDAHRAAPHRPPPTPTRRLRACVENWPEAEEGEYNPACCRFPKSCSATVYDPSRVTDEDLEPTP